MAIAALTDEMTGIVRIEPVGVLDRLFGGLAVAALVVGRREQQQSLRVGRVGGRAGKQVVARLVDLAGLQMVAAARDQPDVE